MTLFSNRNPNQPERVTISNSLMLHSLRTNHKTQHHSEQQTTICSICYNFELTSHLSSFLFEPMKEGWLTKQGKVVKSWKKRWFVLKDNTLSYYKSKEYFLKVLQTATTNKKT